MPLLRRGTGVFFCIQIKRDFSDAQCSFASAPGASQMSAEKVHQPNELRQNNEMLLDYMSVKQTFLSCTVSHHCAHGARSDRIIINKRTRDCIRVCRQLSHEITKKGGLKRQTVHARMNALHFRTSLKYSLHTKI